MLPRTATRAGASVVAALGRTLCLTTRSLSSAAAGPFAEKEKGAEVRG